LLPIAIRCHFNASTHDERSLSASILANVRIEGFTPNRAAIWFPASRPREGHRRAILAAMRACLHMFMFYPLERGTVENLAVTVFVDYRSIVV
jgi:hypothetical protein